MKFVMSVLLAATFATPAFATDAEIKAIKQMGELRAHLVNKTGATKNAEEERGDKAYRLEDLKDPNAKAGRDVKSWSVGPWIGGMRQRVLTPIEMEREQREGKYTTYRGSQVGLEEKLSGGLRLKIKFGAQQ